MTTFESMSRNLAAMAEGLVGRTSVTTLGIASIFAGISASLAAQAVGREGAAKILRELADSLERGEDLQIERLN